MFNLGGLIGTLLTIPAAKLLGRRKMFGIYFAGVGRRASWRPSASTCTPRSRLYMYFLIGLTVFGVFGSFTYYLPELFPTRLRGTGAGFCYNVGRIIAAAGPFLVGTVAARGADALTTAMQAAVLGRPGAARRRAAAADRRRDQGPRAGLGARTPGVTPDRHYALVRPNPNQEPSMKLIRIVCLGLAVLLPSAWTVASAGDEAPTEEKTTSKKTKKKKTDGSEETKSETKTEKKPETK